jgi:lysophospholipase L1-like esterase
MKDTSADLVIILGGSNDVYVGRSAERISKNLQTLHETALNSSVMGKKQVRTVAITIPEVSEMFIPDLYAADQIRLEVNENLRSFAESNRDRVALLDLESAFEQVQPENLIYWSSDRVHLISEGYDAVGQMLYELISTHTITKDRGDIDINRVH